MLKPYCVGPSGIGQRGSGLAKKRRSVARLTPRLKPFSVFFRGFFEVVVLLEKCSSTTQKRTVRFRYWAGFRRDSAFRPPMAALSLVTGILAIALGSVDGQLVQQKALADLQPGDTNQV